MLGRWLARLAVASGARRERRGDLAAATRRYRRAAALAPRYAPAWLNLGAVLEAAGEAVEAERAYEALRAAEPANPFALYNLARLRYARGELAVAEPLLREALAARPAFADAWVMLAAVQEARGAPEDAATSLERALELQPGHAGTWLNYADLAWRIRRPEAAERALRRVMETAPGEAFAHFQVARLEQARGRLAEADALLERAVAGKPDFADAWLLRSGVLMKLDRLDAAQAAARRAVEIDPGSAAAHYALGAALRAKARLGEAGEALATAARLAPARRDLEPAALLALTLADDVSAEAVFARHRDYGARLESALAPRYREWRGEPAPERRLRLGFLSSDFYRHPVAWFVQPLFESLDRSRVEVRVYAVGERKDETTAALRAAVDAWTDAADLGDEALADAIHADGVDILIDLTGHAGTGRLSVFAYQPAPVQASWLGYLHSTGLTRIGWRITDARADPPGEAERLHTERLARLPHALWCFRPPVAVAHAPVPPSARGTGVTFGSFQHLPKISPSARQVWAEILRSVPGSRMLMVGVPEGEAREDLRRDFRAAGVDPARLELVARLPLPEYYRRYDEVDIVLDTFPYGGGTTTLDALWMGVPVLTLAGDRSMGRSAASILGELGLEAWVARTPQAYVRLALERAADAEGRAALRTALRGRLRASALMDEAGFARDMEALLRGLWRDWCARAVA
ncbi:MAG TPA: tetratricopeptide repeat protein [Burkholderiales bacterium]|nr:tetratricopeptide repeat protein [Burkholderiales bacterium]